MPYGRWVFVANVGMELYSVCYNELGWDAYPVRRQLLNGLAYFSAGYGGSLIAGQQIR